MLFQNRKDAGIQLVSKLKKYKKFPECVVIGLPRGGVVVAFEVARELSLPLDVVFPRKVGAPFNPELALGAVCETGQGVFNQQLIEMTGVSEKYLKQEIEKEKQVAIERLQSYRKVASKIDVKEKTAIIVDDGIATGATMKAAIQSIKKEGAKAIVVAVPVSPPDTIEEIKKQVDDVVFLYAPQLFQAVGQFYSEFYPTENEEVIELLMKNRKNLAP